MTTPYPLSLRPRFFSNDTATTEIYTLSLHDALPIWDRGYSHPCDPLLRLAEARGHARSEEHTSELQSRFDLVCRLLLEKKKPDAAGRPAARASSAPAVDPSTTTDRATVGNDTVERNP